MGALTLAFERSEQGVLIATDAGGRWANAAAARLLGVDARVARERPLADLLPELRSARDEALVVVRGAARVALRVVRDERDATTVVYLTDAGPGPGPRAGPREDEAHLSRVEEDASKVIWLASADLSTALYVGPSFERVYGWSAEVLRDGLRGLLRIVHPDDRARVAAVIEGAAGRAWEHEFRVVRPDGVVRWVCDRGFPVHDPAGRVDRYVGLAEDVTETRARDEALRGSEAELRGLVGAMTDLIFVVDREGRHLKVGPTAPQLLYRPAERVLGRTLHEIFPRQLADEMLVAVRRALDEQRTMMIEYDLPIRGTRRWFSAALSPMDADHVVWVARDETERVRAERERRKAYDTLTTLVDRSPLAIVGVDDDRRVTIWNEAAERIFGYAREEILGQLLPLVPEERRDEFADFQRLIAEGGEGITNLETQRRRKDGSLVDVLVSTATITGADGRRTTMAFLADISERRHLEEKLRKAQKMEAIGRLAGGVAHDFNNILTAIINYSELLLQKFRADDAVRADLAEILRAGQRATVLTRQLLTFSRRQLLQPQSLDLGEVVVGMQAMLRRVIGEDIRLETAIAKDGDRVRADGGGIEQVILNLAVNARDAMPAGGTLRLAVDRRAVSEREAERHAGAAAGDYLELSVTDTGHGMPPETLARIFEPFFTTKEAGKGTGLGLATVYGIIQQSGGFITVESTVGKGTTFRVFLPRWVGPARVERAAGAPGAAPAEASGHGSILLVEDDDAVRTVARRVLERHGYQVLEAADGRQALELLERGAAPVDLVLTDLVMPELGGRDLVQRLSERGIHPAVLYMSGYTDDALLVRGELPVGTSLLEKPFTEEGLLSHVRRALAAPRSLGSR